MLPRASHERYCATREQRKTRRKKPLDARTRVPTGGADMHARAGYMYAVPHTHNCFTQPGTCHARVCAYRRPVEISLQAIIRSEIHMALDGDVLVRHTYVHLSPIRAIEVMKLEKFLNDFSPECMGAFRNRFALNERSLKIIFFRKEDRVTILINVN